MRQPNPETSILLAMQKGSTIEVERELSNAIPLVDIRIKQIRSRMYFNSYSHCQNLLKIAGAQKQ